MSTPTPDYGEPWSVDSARGVMDKNNDAICYPIGTARFELIMAERIADCVNACAGIPDPATEIARLRSCVERWEQELSAAMPPDFKDWFQNDKSEWPTVARRVIESLHESDAEAWEQLRLASAELVDVKTEKQALKATIALCEDTIKTMNAALKICMTLLENMYANRNHHKVAAYTDEIEAAMAQIKTCYDPHA